MSRRINPHLNAVLNALGIENKKLWLDAPPDKLGRLVKAIADRAKEHTEKQLAERTTVDCANLTLVPKSYYVPTHKGTNIGAKPFSFPEGSKKCRTLIV